MKKLILLLTINIIVNCTLSYAQPIPRNAPTADRQVAPPRTDAQNIPSVPDAYDAQAPLNYIRTWQPKKPITEESEVSRADRIVSEVGHTTQYFDGLGRPLQTVAWQALPGSKDERGNPIAGTNRDLVAPVVYNEFGREVYKYLPYASGSNDGNFKTNPFAEQQDFYNGLYQQQQRALSGETVFYSKTQYEASPLNRVEKTFAPGNSWAGSEGTQDEHSLSVQYLINEESDDVKIWTIDFNNLTYENNDAGTNIPSVSDHPYEGGQLYKTVTTDEQKNEVVEYKDKDGHVVLKKVQAGEVTEGDPYRNWLLTYYVYDDLGQLRFVIPPKAVAGLRENGWQFTDDIINELCFRYEYDAKQRLTAKKVPGAGWVYMIYNSRDRLAFTQDANLRTRQQWLYTLYDALNRSVETGIMTDREQPDQLQARQDAVEADNPGRTVDHTVAGDFVSGARFSSAVIVCDNPILDEIPHTPLTLTYYDDYSQTSKIYVPDYADLLGNAELALGDNNVYPDYPASNEASRMTTGLVTSTRVRVIADPDNLDNGNWLETVTWYDDKGRAIQTNSDNYGQGTDIATSLYDFTGKVLSAFDAHTNRISTSKPQTSVLTTMRYDEGGRLLEVHKELDSDVLSDRIIASYQYDAMGQVLTKNLGQKRNTDITDGSLTTGPVEGLGYSYNIRGWLKGINWSYGGDGSRPEVSKILVGETHTHIRHWFSMDLSYDWGYDYNQYNGNIAGMRWRSKGDGVQRSYGYGYDKANRLLYGDFNQAMGTAAYRWDKLDPDGSGLQVDFSMMTGADGTGARAYDENGNILSLNQKGLLFTGAGAGSDWIDRLDYGYTTSDNTSQTNKLTAVSDRVRTDNKLGDFTDGNPEGDDYRYDDNGNLTLDNNKHISAITYNHLNLPQIIRVKDSHGERDKGTITYTYDAAGNKLQKVTDEYASEANGQTEKITITTYCGAFTYESGRTIRQGETSAEPTTLQFISHEEGRIRILQEPPNPEDGTTQYAYDYFLKDHLGNVRMVLSDEYKREAFPSVTFEDANTSTESLFFDNVDKDRTDQVPPDFQNVSPGEKVQLLRKNTSDASASVGAGKLLRVMAGDQLNARVNYYTPDETAHNDDASGINTLIAGLGAILGGTASPLPVHGAANAVTSSLQSSPPVTSFMQPQQPDAGDNMPKAYLNVVFFDEQFHFVSEGSTAVQVSVKGSGANLTLPAPIEAVKNGYVYIYLSNESNNFVYFDELQVVQRHGPLAEETHYYPFGLTMSGISSKALSFGDPGNKKKYNGIEFDEDLDLDSYEAFFRDLDPQTGRWWQIDPKIESMEMWSPYASNYDNPIRYNDFKGDDPCCGFDSPPDRKGLITEPTAWEYNNNPVAGTIQQVTHNVASLLGINALDDYLSDLSNPNTSATDKVKATADFAGTVITSAGTDGMSVEGGMAGEIGGAAKSEIKTVTKGGAEPNNIGKTGEQLTGSDLASAKERYTGASGNKRIADKSTTTTVEETKNVSYQHLSTQLKDAVTHAQNTGRKFILWLRESTKVSKPLQEKIENGTIERKKIPGSK